MRRTWLRILQIFRQRRSERLLVKALRRVPKPVPPDGLRDRLLDQAAATAIAASAPPGRHRRWIAAAAATAVLAATVVSLAWWSSVHRNDSSRLSETGPKPSKRRTVETPPKPRVVEKPKEQPGPETVQRRPHIPELRPKIAYQTPYPKLERVKPPIGPRMVKAPSQDAGSRTSDSAGIVVTVSRTPRNGEGYARAAAYDTNTAGETVKTEWTIADDPDSRISSQEFAVTDASGQQSQVTVACSNRKVQKNGEEL